MHQANLKMARASASIDYVGTHTHTADSHLVEALKKRHLVTRKNPQNSLNHWKMIQTLQRPKNTQLGLDRSGLLYARPRPSTRLGDGNATSVFLETNSAATFAIPPSPDASN